MISSKKVLAELAAAPGSTARELARKLSIAKSDLNPVLYALERQGKAIIDSAYRWFIFPQIQSRNPVVQKPSDSPIAVATPTDAAGQISKVAATSCRPPNQCNWTDEQQKIINAPVDYRVLVEAGPGTGKTAVACGRVAKLLRDDELNPSSILMVSFTRTAVAEMKSRIRLWADSGRVNAVNICTLDQAAFQFGIGCGQKFENLMGDFEGNIEATVENISSGNPLLLEYIRGLNHVIVDEAQDLTGLRSRLVRLLLNALSPSTGATILADEAQAIYGFTNDVDDDGRDGAEQFLKAFDAGKSGFKKASLEIIHRTHDHHILKLFRDARQALREGGLDQVIRVAENAAQDLGDDVKKLPLKDGDLVLYRKRASALMHIQFCPCLFRLRLPNYPPPIFPWIALAFSNCHCPLVSRAEFDQLWSSRVPVPLRDEFTTDSAWALLHRFAADREDVSLSKLRKQLARPRPRMEFCYVDYGGSGPIFSTIHASKGREADRVFLMLPRNLNYLEGNSAIDRDEEARVFYVGSTRVRAELYRGSSPTVVRAGRLDQSGRRVAQILDLGKRPKFQIGLQGDLDDTAAISRNSAFCSSDLDAQAHQDGLLKLWSQEGSIASAMDITATCVPIAATGGRLEYFYHFDSAERFVVAWSGKSLHKDLWTACNVMQDRARCSKLRPPRRIERLRLIGLRTCAVDDNPAITGNLREPYATSGFWLAPMIVGFPSVFLEFQKA